MARGVARRPPTLTAWLSLAHKSIAGGYHNALVAAQELGCDTVQIFTKNNNQWAGKPLTAKETSLFRQKLAESKLQLPMA